MHICKCAKFTKVEKKKMEKMNPPRFASSCEKYFCSFAKAERKFLSKCVRTFVAAPLRHFSFNYKQNKTKQSLKKKLKHLSVSTLVDISCICTYKDGKNLHTYFSAATTYLPPPGMSFGRFVCKNIFITVLAN
jgi:hypothetical protein